MRIIFMGTPAFALPALTALLASEHTVVAAYTQPPRPAGRGMKLTPSPIHQCALEHGVPVHTPARLKTADEHAIFAQYEADVAVVAAYGLLLPPAILTGTRLGCINIHPSELPRWRGAAPLHRTIMAGDRSTACCIMQMDEGLDTGPVLARTAYTIADGTTTGQLHDHMAQLGATMTLDVLRALEAGTAHATPQPQTGATYAAKLTKADQFLDWSQDATTLLHQVRGLNPAPVALVRYGLEQFKLFEATAETGDAAQPPGTVLDDRLLVNAGHGTALRLTRLQRPGKSPQDAATFLQGLPIAAASHFLPSPPQD